MYLCCSCRQEQRLREGNGEIGRPVVVLLVPAKEPQVSLWALGTVCCLFLFRGSAAVAGGCFSLPCPKHCPEENDPQSHERKVVI